MKRKFFLAVACALWIFVFLPSVAFAQGSPTATPKVTNLENPIPSIASSEDIPVFIGIVISRILVVVGALTLFVFVYGATRWIQSAGSEDKVRAGTHAMLFAVIGLAVIFASY